MSTETLPAARAEALFASDVRTGSRPTVQEATSAIRSAVRAYGGVLGCALRLAGEYGEHPETAVSRMRWARSVVEVLYGQPHRTSLANLGQAHCLGTFGRAGSGVWPLA
jgi:hypothetical protein